MKSYLYSIIRPLFSRKADKNIAESGYIRSIHPNESPFLFDVLGAISVDTMDAVVNLIATSNPLKGTIVRELSVSPYRGQASRARGAIS